MDDHRWDDLTRSLARGVSRRTVLKGLVGAVISGVLVKSETQTADAHVFGPHNACARWCAAVLGAGTAAAGKCTLECGKVERVVGIDPDHVEGDALFRERSPGQEV